MIATAETTGPNPGGAGAPAAGAVEASPETVELLRRHSAGEKLTASEYGHLGQHAKQKRRHWWNFGKGDSTPGPAPGPAGHPDPVGPVAPAQAPDGSLAPVQVDDDIARRTFAALLEHGDDFFVRFIEREARLAGATDDQLRRFRSSAALSANDKKLLIELAPDICRDLGIDPRKMATWTAVGILGLHGMNLWQVTGELRDMRREKPAAPAAAPETARGSVAPTKDITRE